LQSIRDAVGSEGGREPGHGYVDGLGGGKKAAGLDLSFAPFIME
jgi:hypothetical protein